MLGRWLDAIFGEFIEAAVVSLVFDIEFDDTEGGTAFAANQINQIANLFEDFAFRCEIETVWFIGDAREDTVHLVDLDCGAGF